MDLSERSFHCRPAFHEYKNYEYHVMHVLSVSLFVVKQDAWICCIFAVACILTLPPWPSPYTLVPALGSIWREAKELQPMLEKKGALRRAGAMPALHPIGLGMPVRLLPHPRQTAKRAGAPQAPGKVAIGRGDSGGGAGKISVRG